MIEKKEYRVREDGVKLFRRYSTVTPTLKQLPTNIIYDCWVYKMDEEGNPTDEVDWEKSGVIDVEKAPLSQTCLMLKLNFLALQIAQYITQHCPITPSPSPSLIPKSIRHQQSSSVKFL